MGKNETPQNEAIEVENFGFDSVETVDSQVSKSVDAKSTTQLKSENRVSWFARGGSGAYFSISRLMPGDSRLSKVNAINDIDGLNFNRAYTVQLSFSFINPVTGFRENKTTVMGRVGIANNRIYLLNSSGRASIKSGGESVETRDKTIATVQRAIRLAENAGTEFSLRLPGNVVTESELQSVENEAFNI